MASLNGDIFVVGGMNARNIRLRTVERLDISVKTPKWTIGTPMLATRTDFGLAATRDALYAVGGNHDASSNLASVERYSPSADTWAVINPMPIPRTFLGVGVIGGFLYAVGGGNDNISALSTTAALDLDTGTWTVGPAMSVGRIHLAVAVGDTVAGTRLYAIGGDGTNRSSPYLKSVEYLHSPAATGSASVSTPTTATTAAQVTSASLIPPLTSTMARSTSASAVTTTTARPTASSVKTTTLIPSRSTGTAPAKTSSTSTVSATIQPSTYTSQHADVTSSYTTVYSTKSSSTLTHASRDVATSPSAPRHSTTLKPNPNPLSSSSGRIASASTQPSSTMSPAKHHGDAWSAGIIVLILAVTCGFILLTYLGISEHRRRRERKGNGHQLIEYEEEASEEISMIALLPVDGSTVPTVASSDNLPSDSLVAAACENKDESSDEDALPPIPQSAVTLSSEQVLSIASKYSAADFILGMPEEAALGLPAFLGVNDTTVGGYLVDGAKSIENEIQHRGTNEDKENLEMILAGHYVRAGVTIDADSRRTIEELLCHPNAVAARLKRQHILALRLYTTSTFRSINDPMRRKERPHPLAATVYFISEGIKLLRAVPTIDQSVIGEMVFWRGLSDMKLAKTFLHSGGTEYACMSTSRDRAVAMEFAVGESPLLFKFVTQDFMQRGADISFLSVYPEEREVLYPALTYLRPLKVYFETYEGKRMVISETVPVFPS